MREIGGYLELEHFTGAEYHQNALRFNTATNALLWLLKKRLPKNLFSGISVRIGVRCG